MNEINRFTIRVYGILEHENNILLSEEWIEDFHFTKFPGGGLEFGEGTKDCLKREFMEETGMEVEIGNHFYTTDFFQQSAFRKTDQILSVYYKVIPKSDPAIISTERFGFIQHGRQEYIKFKWISKDKLTADMLTFPIDKKVAGMIIDEL